MSQTDGVLVQVDNVEKTFRRGSEEIHVLAGLHLDVPRGEFLAEVLDDDFISAALAGLVFYSLELVSLPEFGGERDEFHAGVTLFEPGENDGCVQAAGLGENDFLGILLRRRVAVGHGEKPLL